MELSELFVNDLGLLCYYHGDFVTIDIGINAIFLGNKVIVGYCPNVYSIYEDPELVFRLLQENYGLFINEDYVAGMYSIEYLLSLRAQFTKD